jgi:type III restriction enzyme
MSADFKKIAAIEIEEFKQEYRLRFPGRDAEDLADEDILREVMNTVGKAGKLGESIRCVISVSMLTEGWDANTVTHILGVRAFGTQLLCEQVVGRGLRRRSYAVNDKGMFDAEYAEVYGVPFSFIPSAGSEKDPKPGPTPTRVRALEDRIACEITFPRVIGYRYQFESEKLRLKDERLNRVDFHLAALLMSKYFSEDGDTKPWLFPHLLQVVRNWRETCLTCKDNAFPQMLLLVAFAHTAAEKIYQAIVTSTEGARTLLPILRPHDRLHPLCGL